MIEFEATPSGKLTAQEFETVDLEEECDPPAFTRSREKEKKLQELLEKEKGFVLV